MAAGRPREFDPDEALDRALEVFWHRGYEGASLPELTKAMGINRPSMYATFGNKEALFRKAMDRYAEGPAAYVRAALERPVAREAIEQILAGTVALLSDPTHPKGCFAVQGALACGEASEGIQKDLADRRMAGLEAVRKRLERAKSEGDLPDDLDPENLARFLMTIMHGLAVQAAGGATRQQMEQVVKLVMMVWPKNVKRPDRKN
ncbi:TetR/AcrR family transcriptional regulator [Zavarzinella formosa]|uniref:TetR/AcrR family transcriptional regulator n=1 Tax=Zavarzinella formosa TaxID=360055 RepID=UPI0002E47435|nr:TetR/AcrR family transcriptional regulator [Zavarzinella formosa]